MDEQRVHRVQRQPLQRLLARAHDAIVGIVETHLEIQPASPGRAVKMARVRRAVEGAPDLGRDDELVARQSAQEAAQPVLGEAPPVPGGGVVEADSAVPGGLQCGAGIGLGNGSVKLAQMGAAVANQRQNQIGVTQRPATRRCEGH